MKKMWEQLCVKARSLTRRITADRNAAMYFAYGIGWALMIACVLAIAIAGCSNQQPEYTKSTPRPPVQAARVEARPSPVDVLCLMPGQSAMLLEDVIVVARVPYSDNALYVGKVKIGKGTMLVKPKEEK